MLIETVHAAGVIEDAIPISQVLLNVVSFLLSVAGIVGILGLVIAGIFYILSRGDEQAAARAKMAMTYAAVGVAVIAGTLLILLQVAGFFR